MKKIISIDLVVLMLAATLCLASCGNDKKFVSVDAADLLKEDFGIAVKKGNSALMAEVNKVIDAWVADGTMTKYVDYYTQLADYEADVKGVSKPEAGELKVDWDFGSATEVITVYTESGFAPFEFVSNGKVIGVDIAIMSEVAERLGKNIVIEDVAFDTIPTCVKNAEGDAVGAAGVTISDSRKQSVDFSAVYYSSTLVIVSNKEQSYSKLSDLTGLKVGVQEGTSGDLISTDAASSEGYVYENEDGQEVIIKVAIDEVKAYKQYSLAFADLKAGRIDAIVMDKLPALTMLNLIG